MRNISFALTACQILQQTKTVTRRLGWVKTPRGLAVRPVFKAQGIPRGGHPTTLGGAIIIVDVRREALDRMLTDQRYGLEETHHEGFPAWTPEQFVEMFTTHNNCLYSAEVTRIEFRYAVPLYAFEGATCQSHTGGMVERGYCLKPAVALVRERPGDAAEPLCIDCTTSIISTAPEPEIFQLSRTLPQAARWTAQWVKPFQLGV
jgi:hypothetical protein